MMWTSFQAAMFPSPLTRRVGFLLEPLPSNLTNLESVDAVVMGHAGVAVHF